MNSKLIEAIQFEEIENEGSDILQLAHFTIGKVLIERCVKTIKEENPNVKRKDLHGYLYNRRKIYLDEKQPEGAFLLQQIWEGKIDE